MQGAEQQEAQAPESLAETHTAFQNNPHFYFRISAAVEVFLTNMSPDMREEVPVRAT